MNNEEKILLQRKMVSGFGQFHTDEIDPVRPEKRRTPYADVTIDQIRQLVDNPQQTDKASAQWVIFSTLPSRSFKAQEAQGEFLALCADIDHEAPSLDILKAKIINLIGDSDYEIYTTRSATADLPKSRIIIPLFKPLSGANWTIYQEILNDQLEAVGVGVDRASQRPGQLFYLPNRGSFYDSRSNRNNQCFDPVAAWSDIAVEKLKGVAQAEQEAQKKREEAAKNRDARIIAGGANLIDAFNQAYPVEELLIRAKYCQRGNAFRHPNSESGSFSAMIRDGRVNTLSTSDPLYSEGNGAHDAFSVFCVLWHDGRQDAALRDAGENWLAINGESWNSIRQREIIQDIHAGELTKPNGDVFEPKDVCTKSTKKLKELDEIKIWKPMEPKVPQHLLKFPGNKLNEYMRWIDLSAEDTVRAVSIASVIHLACVTTARAARTNKNNHSSLYLLVVAPSGYGKNYGKNAVSTLMKRAKVHFRITNKFYSEGGIYSAILTSPTTVFHLDEFGDKVKHGVKTGSPVSGAFSFLKEVYSSTSSTMPAPAYSTIGLAANQVSQIRDLQHPCVNVYGLTTPGQLWDGIDGSSVEGGFMNRLIGVIVTGSDKQTNQNPEYEPPDELIEHIGYIRCVLSSSGNMADQKFSNIDIEPYPSAYRFCEKGLAQLDAFKKEIEDLGRKDEFMANMTARWRENAMRMALGLHVFNDPVKTTIGLEITKWCIDYVRFYGRWFANEIHEHSSPGSEYGRMRRDILAGFRARPEGTAPTVLGRSKPWKNIKTSIRTEIIRDLIDSHLLAEVAKPIKGQRGQLGKLYVAVADSS